MSVLKCSQPQLSAGVIFAFWSFEGGQMHTLCIPYISCIYSMYIHNYMHVQRDAGDDKGLPSNNYVHKCKVLVMPLLDEKSESVRRCCMAHKFLKHLIIQRVLAHFLNGVKSYDVAKASRDESNREAFLAEISVRSPQTLFNIIVQTHFYRIKVSPPKIKEKCDWKGIQLVITDPTNLQQLSE